MLLQFYNTNFDHFDLCLITALHCADNSDKSPSSEHNIISLGKSGITRKMEQPQLNISSTIL